MTRFLPVFVFALIACNSKDQDASASPGSGGMSSGSGGMMATGTGGQPSRPLRSSGHVAETGVSVIALSLPKEEPKQSHVNRVELDDSECESAEEDDAGSTPDSCSDNHAPVLGEPLFEIDGLVYDQLPIAFAGDEVLLLIPYSDADCNLSCGTTSSKWTFSGPDSVGDGASGGIPLPANMPCSTEDSNTYLGLWAPGAGARGTATYELAVRDACGAAATGKKIGGAITYITIPNKM